MSTIKDIASIAGVSTSTVSHVVNRTRFVSAELEARVLKAIAETDTPPNFIAKKRFAIEQKMTSPFVLLLISDKESYFQSEVERRLKELMEGTDLGLVSFAYNESRQSLELCLNTLLASSNLAGILLFPDEDETAARKILGKTGLPTVVIGQIEGDVNADQVYSDTLGGAFIATRHLIRNGHERIALLSGTNSQHSKRMEGYRRALEAHGIAYDPDIVRIGLSGEHSVAEAMNSLFNGMIHPTALLVANYSISRCLFQYLGMNNILCPEELSLVCFNDFHWAELLSPPLTVVDQDVKQIANKALELLEERMGRSRNTTLLPARSLEIPTRLKVRSSTAGIAHGPFGEKAEKLEVLQLGIEELQALSERRYSAAISFHYTGKAWMDLTIKGINSIFDQMGISLIAITDAHFDPVLQSKQLASIAMLEPDVLIAMSTDNTLTAPAFRAIADTPTKLVLLTNVPQGITPDDYDCCVSVNEHAHGRNIGIGLAEYMLRHGLSRLGMLKHDADFYATNQRDRAAEQVLTEEYQGLSVCGIGLFENEADAYGATQNLMREHPEIEALYVPWDGPANEAMRALLAIDRMDVSIATGDLDMSNALVMARGGMIKMISAQSPYEQGVASALAAAGALLGKKLPKFVAIEPISITPSNLLKAWKTVFKYDAPQELRDALKQNSAYINGGS